MNALADKDNEIKELKGTIEYYKNQERIRTDQLRATESKVEELHKHVENFNYRIHDLYKNIRYWKDEYLVAQEERDATEEDNKILHERLYSAEELITKLSKENEKLKVEVTEALAKRDYWQDLANKEAADAKKVKWDCEKEMEWQKKKLQEFDYVLTKYRAKIKELEDANRFSELVINLIIKE